MIKANNTIKTNKNYQNEVTHISINYPISIQSNNCLNSSNIIMQMKWKLYCKPWEHSIDISNYKKRRFANKI